ncbi:AAA family ATPase (plasmid) [Lentzea sp. JNUCC 0626]|uniref:AAA family ATPase n=1 Tax=Lentzea sp. JNUCC 0626 TaxID=3367513 RepID=UPI0037495A6E
MTTRVFPATPASPETPVLPGKQGLPDVVVGGPQLIALIGPPGAGKTTLRRRHLPGVEVVHLDENRGLLSPFGCEADQAVTAAAVQMATVQAGALLAAGRPVLWDATSAVRADRLALQVLAAEHRARSTAIVQLPDLAVCLARNALRDDRPCACGFARRVPEEIVAAMHAEILGDLDGLRGEGWDEVLFAELPAGTGPGASA